MSIETPPILFTIFNRADLTGRVFERIRKARPARLYIAADGPRLDKEGEIEVCELTRKITENIDWPCECKRLYRNANLGCRIAMAEAITWFFDDVDAGVILEDDCLPDLSFFKFCAELLDKYRDDPRVATIGGVVYHDNANPEELDSYYYSRYPLIWGWASWRRFWVTYDIDIARWKTERNHDEWLPANTYVRQFWSRIFDQVSAGRVDTWDYQVTFQCLREGYLSIQPNTNLVDNIGFDERATHTIRCDKNSALQLASEMKFPLRHPSGKIVDEAAARYIELTVLNIPKTEAAARFRVLKQKVGRLLRGLMK